MSQGWGLFARRYVHTPTRALTSPLFFPLAPNAIAEVEPRNPMSFGELSLMHCTWHLNPLKVPDVRLNFKARYYRDRARLAYLDQDLAYAKEEMPERLPRYYFELANLHLSSGDLDQAQACLDVVLEHTVYYNEVYWRQQVATMRALIVQCADPEGVYEKYRDDYVESRDMFYGAHPSLMPTLMRVVCSAMAAAEIGAAISHCEAMLQDAGYFNCLDDRLWARSTLAVLDACAGSVVEAQKGFQLVIHSAAPDSPQRLFAHLNLARVLPEQELTRACAHLESAAVLASTFAPDCSALSAFIRERRQAMRSDEFHQTVTSTI